MSITEFTGKIQEYFTQELKNLGNGLEVSTDGGKTFIPVEQATFQLRSVFQIPQEQPNNNEVNPVVSPQSAQS